MIGRLVLILTVWVLAAMPSRAQSIIIKCAPMPIIKLKPGLWQAQRSYESATVTLPGGEVLTFKDFEIPPTLVRGIVARAVDPCVASGTADDGSVMTLQLPREPVILGVAQKMVAVGSLTRPSGATYSVTVTYPSCVSRPVLGSLGRKRIADAVTATGSISTP